MKSGKRYLLNATQGELLTTEQFTTFSTQVEAILNSRPLYWKREVTDLEVIDIIMPGHFLVGFHLLKVPPIHTTFTSLSDRLGAQRNTVRSSWRQWYQNYLVHLNSCSKWKTTAPCLNVGDIVLIKDDSALLHWPLARVIEVFPDKHGHVRIVCFKSRNTTYLHSIQNLVKLPVEPCYKSVINQTSE